MKCCSIKRWGVERQWRGRVVAGLVCLALGSSALAGLVGSPSVVAGSNYDIDFNAELDVPFSGFAGAWFAHAKLIHNPDAGPMIKSFESPISDTLDPILLDAQQPFPIAVRETFEVYEPPILDPLDPSAAPINPFFPVYGWHEDILTEGWQWVLPDDTHYPGGPLFGKPLIERNGNPHPSYPSISIALYQPDVVSVEFARIDAGETLGINKALLWVGTEGNRVWGDGQLDDGTPHREDAIRVWEHPTFLGSIYEFAGNFNGDYVVDQADLDLVLQNWGRDADATGLPRGWFSTPADGIIDQGELDQVLTHWGNNIYPGVPLAGDALPEPGVAALVLGGLVFAGSRRKSMQR